MAVRVTVECGIDTLQSKVEAETNTVAEAAEPTPEPIPKPTPKSLPTRKAQPKLKTKSAPPGARKRAKPVATSDEEPSDAESSAASSESDAPSIPTKKRKLTKSKATIDSDAESSGSASEPPKKRELAKSKAAVDSGAESSAAESEAPTKLIKKRRIVKAKAVVESESEGSSALSEPLDTPEDIKPKAEDDIDDNKQENDDHNDAPEVTVKSPKLKKSVKGTPTKPGSKSQIRNEKDVEVSKREEDSGSDTSVVYDEPPKPKRKKTAKSSEAPPKKRRSQGAGTAKAAASDQSPDDALIKQLQGQLLKCGVRKIWGFELKKYGEDKKAKIRHLKGRLTDVGMTGRFSESRAREIKEQRELLADLDDVMEGEKHWGVSGRPARLARGRATKGLKESSDEEGSDKEPAKAKGVSNNSGDDSDSDEDMQPKVHGGAAAKRRADLAFLGDESESD